MANTTLTAAQSGDGDDPGFLLASAAAAGPRGGDFLIQIDDEFEYVEWRGDQATRPWQVRRGFLGSTIADHSNGATVLVEPAVGATTVPVAAFVDPATGTAEDIATALIAAGLMASS